MGNQIFSFDFQHYDSLENLPKIDKSLVMRAREACETSFSPYSNFKVGAAVLLENGEILTASNQESEVFPSGICAERSLLYYIQANHRDIKILTIAITSDPAVKECYPCGACRQVIVDTEKRQSADIKVIMCGGDSATILEKAQLLLPFTFEL